ncbi:hypothetical protein FQN54_008018 [Arachnomyces sp. PD_36]|nr:hypothetical protein FQN54_008018 [Arachnomyces sp. PD_36]
MTYQYQPFSQTDSIRLLKYNEGGLTAQLNISISLASLSITPSLHLALQYLKKRLAYEQEGSETWLWVDQLCINQKDIPERNHQVNLMGKIYSQALRTVIWLGPDNGFAKSAFSLIQQIYATVNKEHPDHENTPVFTVQEYDENFHAEMNRKRNLPNSKSKQWSDLRTILSVEWFTRAWIFQEAVLSKQDPITLCGKEDCSWNVFSTACAWLWRMDYYEEGYLPRSISNVESIRRVWKGKDKWTMSGLLYLTFDVFNAANSRDKVFGLLGLAKNAGQTVPDADYESTPAQTYCRMAKYLIYGDMNLAILSLPTCHTELVPDLYRGFGRQASWEGTPSWTPSFDTCLLTTELVYADEDKASGKWKLDWRSHYQASGDEPARGRTYDNPSRREEDWSVLELDGLEIDEIDTCFEINSWTGLEMQRLKFWKWIDPELLEDTIGYQEKATYLGQLKIKAHQLHTVRQALRLPLVLRLWNELVQKYPDVETMALAKSVWRATTAGMTLDRNPLGESEFAHFATYMVDMYSKWEGKFKSSGSRFHESFDYLAKHVDGGKKEQYEDGMRSACTIRRCFITKNGRVGVGSTSLREKDTVVVFFGAGTPHILRHHDKDWLFVGDCYLDGVMEGQSIEAWRNGEVEEKRFIIR